jgi:hypothetical protein
VVEFDEGIDTNLLQLDGGGSINPAYLPRDPNQGCRPVLPHEYLRVNTIFEVLNTTVSTVPKNRVGQANSGPKYWTPTLVLEREPKRSDATS